MILSEGSHASPASHCDECSMKVKIEWLEAVLETGAYAF
jgi:hypothetical protein